MSHIRLAGESIGSSCGDKRFVVIADTDARVLPTARRLLLDILFRGMIGFSLTNFRSSSCSLILLPHRAP